jgi:hypothetical protein
MPRSADYGIHERGRSIHKMPVVTEKIRPDAANRSKLDQYPDVRAIGR